MVSTEEEESSYSLPVTKNGVLRSVFTEIELANPALNVIRSVLGGYSVQYGFTVGYAQRHKNSFRWSVGLGVYYSGNTYTSAFDAYNRSLSGNLPITIAKGGKPNEDFFFRFGLKVNPFVAAQHTVYSDKYHTEDDEGNTISLDYSHTEKFNESVFGISAMLVPQFVWYVKKKRNSIVLTPLRPGFLTYADKRLSGGITITTSLSVEFFLQPKDDH